MPLMLKNETHLLGHIACLNEMTQLIPESHEMMCIFKGEDAYISANDYPSKQNDHKKVPTWNYQAVHVHGIIKYLKDQKSKLAQRGQLTKTHEQKTNGLNAWKMSDAPKEYLMEQLHKIVVFEIEITKIEAKSKLSQNRESQDFQAVIEALKQRGKVAVATRMQNLHQP